MDFEINNLIVYSKILLSHHPLYKLISWMSESTRSPPGSVADPPDPERSGIFEHRGTGSLHHKKKDFLPFSMKNFFLRTVSKYLTVIPGKVT